MLRIRKATITPMQYNENASSPSALVFKADGLAVPESFHRRHENRQITSKKTNLEPGQLPKDIDFLQGKYLYGGIIFNHFGHFLAESVHRLLAYSEYLNDNEFKVVFAPQVTRKLAISNVADLPQFMVDAFVALGLEVERIVLVKKVTIFEEMYIVEQCHVISGGPRSASYLDLLRNKFKASSIGNSENNIIPKKVFVSRSNFLLSGSVLGLSYLESLFESAGYLVVNPERLPFLDQVGLWFECDTLVMVESSFMHILDLIPPVRTRCMVIPRRTIASYQNSIQKTMSENVGFLSILSGVLMLPPLSKSTRTNRLLYSETCSILDYGGFNKLLDYIEINLSCRTKAWESYCRHAASDMLKYVLGYERRYENLQNRERKKIMNTWLKVGEDLVVFEVNRAGGDTIDPESK